MTADPLVMKCALFSDYSESLAADLEGADTLDSDVAEGSGSEFVASELSLVIAGRGGEFGHREKAMACRIIAPARTIHALGDARAARELAKGKGRLGSVGIFLAVPPLDKLDREDFALGEADVVGGLSGRDRLSFHVLPFGCGRHALGLFEHFQYTPVGAIVKL